MRDARAWLGAGIVAWMAAGCMRPQQQPQQPADTASVRERAETATVAAGDSLRRPPAEPSDIRPWVPDTDTLRIRVDTAAGTPRAARQAPQAQSARPGEWTTGIVEARREELRPVTLREVRTGRHAGWDRVVFEFAGGRVPGYHLEYVDRPVRKCGSGHVTEVAGQGWLQVRLTPAQAHTDEGEATVENRERRLALPVLKELELTCDFEADVTWVVGVSSPNRYRVQELSNPARLVVDVRH